MLPKAYGEHEMSPRPSSRNIILSAAEAVVIEHGASHMTLDAVAAQAKVSKGGLLYHFPSQHHLLMAMLKRFMDQIEILVEQTRASLPARPGQELKAHILAWFSLGQEHRHLASALLAAVTRDPGLLDIVREKRRQKWSALTAISPRPELTTIATLAVEGLWMSELMGTAAYTPREHARIRSALLRLVDEVYGET